MKIKSKLDSWPKLSIISYHVNQHRLGFDYSNTNIKAALRQWLIDPAFANEYINSMGNLIKGENKPLAALYVLFNNIEITYGIESLKQYANDIWHISANRKAA
jgi:hypothetical protein